MHGASLCRNAWIFVDHQVVLARGAKELINIPTNDTRELPLDIALKARDDCIVDILLKNGARRGRQICGRKRSLECWRLRRE